MIRVKEKLVQYAEAVSPPEKCIDKFSADNRFVVLVEDQTIRLFDFTTKQILCTQTHQTYITGTEFLLSTENEINIWMYDIDGKAWRGVWEKGKTQLRIEPTTGTIDNSRISSLAHNQIISSNIADKVLTVAYLLNDRTNKRNDGAIIVTIENTPPKIMKLLHLGATMLAISQDGKLLLSCAKNAFCLWNCGNTLPELSGSTLGNITACATSTNICVLAVNKTFELYHIKGKSLQKVRINVRQKGSQGGVVLDRDADTDHAVIYTTPISGINLSDDNQVLKMVANGIAYTFALTWPTTNQNTVYVKLVSALIIYEMKKSDQLQLPDEPKAKPHTGKTTVNIEAISLSTSPHFVTDRKEAPKAENVELQQTAMPSSTWVNKQIEPPLSSITTNAQQSSSSYRTEISSIEYIIKSIMFGTNTVRHPAQVNDELTTTLETI